AAHLRNDLKPDEGSLWLVDGLAVPPSCESWTVGRVLLKSGLRRGLSCSHRGPPSAWS
ncbi:hypothetical protein M9458_021023, partial [Cirrhinus mrigala]